MNIKESKKGISLRPFDTGDAYLINEFFDSMGGESRAFFNRREYNRKGALKYCKSEDPTRKYWLFLHDGKMGGYVFFLDWNTGIPTLGLAIRDELRGKHIGRELVEFAKNVAREAGKGGIQLTTHLANVRAQALYEATGFNCIGVCKGGTEFFYLCRF